jgi:hypothetical protein
MNLPVKQGLKVFWYQQYQAEQLLHFLFHQLSACIDTET